MIMTLEIGDKYIDKVENFIASLPEGAVEKKDVLDNEISTRVREYRSGKMKTTPFMEGLDKIRKKLVSQL